ncbi:hypothetical protein DVH26_23475 [Paenibacillus sp. H1-7]|nr:hypothetical protein DVH26_23475 [Paenibacillus sp. H1-7]
MGWPVFVVVLDGWEVERIKFDERKMLGSVYGKEADMWTRWIVWRLKTYREGIYTIILKQMEVIRRLIL